MTQPQFAKTPPMPPDDPRMLAQAADEDKRDFVLTLGAPEIVQINVNSPETFGLTEQPDRTHAPDKIRQHVDVAQRLGYDADGYRDTDGLAHSGKKIFEREGRVRLGRLLEQLVTGGYRCTRACFRKTDAKHPRVELIFVKDGQAQGEMPDGMIQALGLLELAFIDGFTLWANPKVRKDDQSGTESWYRHDTLNGFVGQAPKDPKAVPGRTLSFDETGAGYVLA
jgi:hypothetical protein